VSPRKGETREQWLARNREAQREYRKDPAYVQRSRERDRLYRNAPGRRLRRRAQCVGLTPEQLAEHIVGGRCEICGVVPKSPQDPRSLTGDRAGLYAEHYHGSDTSPPVFRGVVCNKCNNALHVFDLVHDDPDYAERLFAFAQRGYPQLPTPKEGT
jgi:hypothetical protein